MNPNRLVAILTPLVFAPMAGAITAWVAQHLPGLPPLDSTQITALFIAGATVAFGKAALWLHGWQQHEVATRDHGLGEVSRTRPPRPMSHNGDDVLVTSP